MILARPFKAGDLPRKYISVALGREKKSESRREAPAVNSPERQLGVNGYTGSEARRAGTSKRSKCRAFGAYHRLDSIPGLTAGPTHYRPFGPIHLD